MRLYTRMTVRETLRNPRATLDPVGYRPVQMSSQNLYSCEEVENMLAGHVPDSMDKCAEEEVNSVYLRFENEWIGIYSRAELRLAVKLATIYHNNLVSENFQHEKDLSGKDYGERFYTPETTPQQATDANNDEVDDSASFASCDSVNSVTDPDFEMNEDLVPWKQECGRWYKSLDEKYGFYM
jgi:hypothetical protein